MFERLSSPGLQWCWNESRLVKLLVFCLLGRKFGQSFFVGVSIVSFYKQAKSVSQQMRNCVCKTQTATTGRQPVTSLTTFVSPVRFLIEIMLILTAIKSHSKMAYDKQNLTLMVIQKARFINFI